MVEIRVKGVVVWSGEPDGDLDVRNAGNSGGGNSVVVFNGKVISGGGPGLTVEIHGDIAGNVTTDGGVVAQSIGGSVKAGGSVTCKNVGGDVKAGGSVNAGDVTGDVSAGGSVNAARAGTVTMGRR